MENKYIFAVYANLGTGYLLDSLNEMAKKLGRNFQLTSWRLVDEDNHTDIKTLLDTCFVSPPANHLEETVEWFFPWIKPLVEKFGFNKDNRENDKLNDAYKTILWAFCKQMDDVRNFYTHVNHPPVTSKELTVNGKPKTTFDCLNWIYDGAVNDVKTRFDAAESEVKHLRRYKGKMLKSNFFYLLSDDNGFTEKGTAFFLSLFLIRKYAYLMLKQLSGFKRSDARRYRFTPEVFTVLSTKPPIQRLRYQEDEDLNSAMDVLNEVSKIPKELYNTLNPAYKKEYNKAYQDLSEDADEVDLRERPHIRYRNRFEPLALRYLDQHDDFKEIGFYAYLGTYHHKEYPKTTIDQIQNNRPINFRLAGFCKRISSDFSAELQHALGIKAIKPNPDQPIENKDFEPYFVEAVNPHYIVNGNNIGIKILPDGRNLYPKIADNGAKLPMPDYWLSKYELPAMLFYAYLRKNEPHTCPKSIREILGQYTLRSTVQESAPEENSALMQKRIERAIFWCDTKLNEAERIGKQNYAYGKKQHQTLRAGRIADILARDMLYLQPSHDEGRDKITGANFQALQRSIAYYGATKDGLSDIFRRAKLLDSPIAHPFLAKVEPRHHLTLSSFYRAYLDERKQYFEAQKNLAMDKSVECYPLRDLQHESQPKQMPSDLPVFLPRGLFNEAITECLKKSALRTSDCFAKSKFNVAYLIQRYFAEKCQNSVQDFYTQPRNYHFIDKQLAKKEKAYLTLEERITALHKFKPTKIPVSEANQVLEKEDYLKRKAYHEVCDNESIIRLYQVQDMLLFLIAKELLPKELSKDVDNFKLQNVKGLLDTSAEFKVRVKNFTVKATGVKIKNYGNVFAVRQDARFRSLAEELQAKGLQEISFNDYLTENEEYEQCRFEIIKLCHRFEDLMVGKFASDLTKETDGYYKFKTLADNYKILCNNEADDFVVQTRNMFMHNSYKKELINDVKKNRLGYAKEIGTRFSAKMNEMIRILE